MSLLSHVPRVTWEFVMYRGSRNTTDGLSGTARNTGSLSSVTNVVGRRCRPAEAVGRRGPRPGTTGTGRGPPVPAGDHGRSRSAAEVEPPSLHGVLDLADEFFEHILEEQQAQHLRLRIDDPGHVDSDLLHLRQRLLDLVIGGDGEQGPEALALDRRVEGVIGVGVEDVLDVEIRTRISVSADD